MLAGPGSGKTRVITYRVSYLIRNHGASPDSIMAVTFTNKAAQEMLARLHSDDLLGETIGMEVWIHTFHAACVRILREFCDEIGLSSNFAVIDQDAQDEIIAQCIRDFAPTISENQVWLVRDFISSAKIRMEDPTEPHETQRLNQQFEDEESIVTLNDMLAVTVQYQDYLKKHDALDFDDLVSQTVSLLSLCPDVKKELRQRFKFIMVDEYQDINVSQYQLIKHLCNSEKNLMVVADDDQSIYSWRGSDPTFIDKFKEDYNPRIIQLTEHFRSTQNLLRASQSLIGKNTRRKKGVLITDNDRGNPIYHYKLDNLDEEMRLVVWLINKLRKEKHYSPGQIAIFYRTHKLADKMEQYLLEHKIEVNRIRRESFFDDPHVKAIVDYLSLMCWDPDLYIRRIVNYPNMVMDELTQLQLERLAKRENLEFGDLMKKIALDENYNEYVGPLTRKRIKYFNDAINVVKEIPGDKSISQIVRDLFEFLESRRNPYHRDDLKALENSPQSGGLWMAVNSLYNAVQQEHKINIITEYGIDNYSAAGIISYVLQDYLDVGEKLNCHFLNQSDIQAGLPGFEQPIKKIEDIQVSEENSLNIIIGPIERIPDHIIKNAIVIGPDDIICLANLPAGPGGVVSTTALKLCQRLLSSYEGDNTQGLVVYDLETIGNNPKFATILEIGAKKIGSRNEDSRFHQLVNPRKNIPKSSTDIHGIKNQDVENKPSIEKVLPMFLRFIDDSVLVGHNIKEFDNKVISRCMLKSGMGMVEFPNRSYDTLNVAKRLYPLENYRLEALADKFNLSHDELHHAEADVEITEKIFRSLRREDLTRSEKLALPEVLPLVAIGILEKDAAIEPENAAFYNAAARHMRHRRPDEGAIELLPISHLEAPQEEEAIGFLDQVKNANPTDTRNDMDWNMTKAKFQNIVLDFEHGSYDKSLSAFLSYAKLLTSSDTSEEDEDKVTMMTVHSAKGKEFNVVIMIGMEQGNFPITGLGQTEEDMEEERRLCYVGMTRAKKQLYMTSVRRRMGDIEKTPSQFIWEIHPELIKTTEAKQIRKAWEKERNKKKQKMISS
ncbi:AAA family ATPase [Candidatus Poribacteria bacterium]|nr:AAA family ATPase [Candidatus Poribacteria bacterium]